MKRGNALAARIGGFVARHHRWFLGAWLVLFGVMAYFSSATPRLRSASGFNADTEASRAGDILRAHFQSDEARSSTRCSTATPPM